MSTDCYGAVSIDWQGANLETRTTRMYAELFRTIGSWQESAAGYCERYFRPNPNSTAGIYVSAATLGGSYGAPLPYVPTVKVSLYLTSSSTQSTALVDAAATAIAIVDKKLFIRSLRRLLDHKSSLKIDPALVAIGPEDLEA